MAHEMLLEAEWQYDANTSHRGITEKWKESWRRDAGGKVAVTRTLDRTYGGIEMPGHTVHAVVDVDWALNPVVAMPSVSCLLSGSVTVGNVRKTTRDAAELLVFVREALKFI